ncbi:MAG: argininosuccinate lyase, partial [Eubacteriaceae bacterium]|nr:argininosuccinate lyase [Eubacteriaceae bacterium]
MEKMWAGRSLGATEKIADELNSSIGFDARLYKEDITGSIAHAKMLSKQGIITEEEKDQIVEGLGKILSGIDDGSIKIDPTAEDIQMFVESVLTEMIGEAGKKVHTARSRNDQVALDMRLYLREQCDTAVSLIKDLIAAVCSKAEEYKECIMPGYTHLQRAQPILFSHEILTYAHMLERDIDRFKETKKRMDVSPIGCCALAGTTYDTDREYEAELLGFPHIALNSLDGVSDRDFCCDFIYDCAMLMMHLSRFSEELILFSSWEFGFIELPEAFTTGSSIMPQKKNPDMAELTRGKTGRVYG